MKLFQTSLLIIVFSIINCGVQAQRGNIWCFGDSAALNFSGGTPFPTSSSVVSRGSCVSIADTNGDLLFYGNTRSQASGPKTGLIWNRNHNLLLN
ncbi:MAG: hypothetical protein JNL49_06315 [Bacteroidia bacterium]|nr:hypothetical protein [Bacteroidia bacterium]